MPLHVVRVPEGGPAQLAGLLPLGPVDQAVVTPDGLQAVAGLAAAQALALTAGEAGNTVQDADGGFLFPLARAGCVIVLVNVVLCNGEGKEADYQTWFWSDKFGCCKELKFFWSQCEKSIAPNWRLIFFSKLWYGNSIVKQLPTPT